MDENCCLAYWHHPAITGAGHSRIGMRFIGRMLRRNGQKSEKREIRFGAERGKQAFVPKYSCRMTLEKGGCLMELQQLR